MSIAQTVIFPSALKQREIKLYQNRGYSKLIFNIKGPQWTKKIQVHPPKTKSREIHSTAMTTTRYLSECRNWPCPNCSKSSSADKDVLEHTTYTVTFAENGLMVSFAPFPHLWEQLVWEGSLSSWKGGPVMADCLPCKCVERCRYSPMPSKLIAYGVRQLQNLGTVFICMKCPHALFFGCGLSHRCHSNKFSNDEVEYLTPKWRNASTFEKQGWSLQT